MAASGIDPTPAVFVCGRQHSGNSVLTRILGKFPDCYAIETEGSFFERRAQFGEIEDLDERIAAVAENLRIPARNREERGALEERVRAALSGSLAPGCDALEIYRRAMAALTRWEGKAFWAQKATSYIFFGDEILRGMPEARMVFLLRSPFDVAASIKRRQAGGDPLFGWPVSWNRALRLVTELGREFEGRVLLMRYEDLTRDSVRVLNTLCEFLGQPFTADLAEVPRVNPADSPYRDVSSERGLDPSRLNTYGEVLTSAEIAALDLVLDSALLEQFYPELSHPRDSTPVRSWLAARVLLLRAAIAFPLDRVRWARRTGMGLREYLGRRVKVLLRRPMS